MSEERKRLEAQLALLKAQGPLGPSDHDDERTRQRSIERIEQRLKDLE